MKSNHLKTQYRRSMLITLAVIAVLSIGTIYLATTWQKVILPSTSELYLDIVYTYADGKEEHREARINYSDADKISIEDENDIEAYQGKKEQDHAVLMPDDTTIIVLPSDTEKLDENIMLMETGKIQTGTKLNIKKIENSFEKLSPGEQKLYRGLDAAKFVLPILYSLIGIVLSSVLFYRRMIHKPVKELAEAAEKIANQNLDFEIVTDSKNELGQLCDSFEEMRKALVDNNKEILRMLEERRMLQSSVAHDLRNPIAILKGYLEMMGKDVKADTFSQEEAEKQIETMQLTTERIENYVNSVSKINKIEDMELNLKKVDLIDVLDNTKNDIIILLEGTGIEVEWKCQVEAETDFVMDMNAFSRIIENIVNNGKRYANSKMIFKMEIMEEDTLLMTITDDGPGYPEKLLKNNDLYFYTTELSSGHMGMGMTVCRLLCQKHKGSLSLSNNEMGGAKTVIRIQSMA